MDKGLRTAFILGFIIGALLMFSLVSAIIFLFVPAPPEPIILFPAVLMEVIIGTHI